VPRRIFPALLLFQAEGFRSLPLDAVLSRLCDRLLFPGFTSELEVPRTDIRIPRLPSLRFEHTCHRGGSFCVLALSGSYNSKDIKNFQMHDSDATNLGLAIENVGNQELLHARFRDFDELPSETAKEASTG
jgi:hypothetical protein